uniref:Mediator of RNA polymerase II transcription subunit 6 n=1 Tax=Gasterosteus aculeatus aculeatus TaxID=481459 RepID=G3PEN9_GASAC
MTSSNHDKEPTENVVFVRRLVYIMAAVDFRDNLLGISWVDSGWVPILNPGNVLDYFSERSNPFYDRTFYISKCNLMVGVEYILLHAQEPILYIIRKQQRQSPTQVIPLADYYIIAGVVYQAPDLGTVISSRALSAVHGIQSAFDEAMAYCRYHPSKGYWWHFKDQEEREKNKPKSKKKEEPSSLFQRHRVDTLLLDLRSKFPPTFYQVHVTLVKKEPEPPTEAVKQEEREPATKSAAPAPPSKPPPEKRARLQ